MLNKFIVAIAAICCVTTNANAGDWVTLFNGKNLEGWTVESGIAKFTVEDGIIVGTAVEGSSNTFLCTEKEYGDFILELESKNDVKMNSGVMFRALIADEGTAFVFKDKKGNPAAKTLPNGRVYGYQAEIATHEAGKSGGIYDEARRGYYIADVTVDPVASKAFKDNQWNKYRIECRGNSLKTWINGVPCADIKDSMTASGVIGLQVHGIKKDFKPWKARFRNIRIQELD